MIISKEELQKRTDIYISLIPRFNWFSSEERVELVMKAERNAKISNSNFLRILENLTFIKSIHDGKPSSQNFSL